MSLNTFAQPTADDFEPIQDVPINSWLIMLLIIGIGVGVNSLYSAKKTGK